MRTFKIYIVLGLPITPYDLGYSPKAIAASKVFCCPADPLPVNWVSGPAMWVDCGIASYAYSYPLKSEKLSNIKNPSCTVIVVDSRVGAGGSNYFFADSSNSCLYTSSGSDNVASSRHNHGLNTLLVDGHVKWFGRIPANYVVY